MIVVKDVAKRLFEASVRDCVDQASIIAAKKTSAAISCITEGGESPLVGIKTAIDGDIVTYSFSMADALHQAAEPVMRDLRNKGDVGKKSLKARLTNSALGSMTGSSGDFFQVLACFCVNAAFASAGLLVDEFNEAKVTTAGQEMDDLAEAISSNPDTDISKNIEDRFVNHLKTFLPIGVSVLSSSYEKGEVNLEVKNDNPRLLTDEAITQLESEVTLKVGSFVRSQKPHVIDFITKGIKLVDVENAILKERVQEIKIIINVNDLKSGSNGVGETLPKDLSKRPLAARELYRVINTGIIGGGNRFQDNVLSAFFHREVAEVILNRVKECANSNVFLSQKRHDDGLSRVLLTVRGAVDSAITDLVSEVCDGINEEIKTGEWGKIHKFGSIEILSLPTPFEVRLKFVRAPCDGCR